MAGPGLSTSVPYLLPELVALVFEAAPFEALRIIGRTSSHWSNWLASVNPARYIKSKMIGTGRIICMVLPNGRRHGHAIGGRGQILYDRGSPISWTYAASRGIKYGLWDRPNVRISITQTTVSVGQYHAAEWCNTRWTANSGTRAYMFVYYSARVRPLR